MILCLLIFNYGKYFQFFFFCKFEVNKILTYHSTLEFCYLMVWQSLFVSDLWLETYLLSIDYLQTNDP